RAHGTGQAPLHQQHSGRPDQRTGLPVRQRREGICRADGGHRLRDGVRALLSVVFFFVLRAILG
ncbi:MAG: hypothetical protein RQ729_13480, partial [Wenzhouxiangellaceae bacterium]|nr:hypothetical protein [Wenzhouxiangellaceae bacterium]